MKLTTFRHIAIIQTAFLGDVALALYFAQTLRLGHPDAKISFVTTPQAADLVRCAKAVDSVIVFDKRSRDAGFRGIQRIASHLRQQKVDLVFGLQRSLRTSVLSKLSGAALCIGFSNATLSLLYTQRYPWLLSQHEIERNHSLLCAFDDTPSISKDVQLNLPQTIAELDLGMDVSISLLGASGSLVALAPGSVWKTKRWSEENFIELAKHFRKQKKTVACIGGDADSELCNRIAEKSNSMSLAGKLSIPQTLLLLKHCELLVTNDSAPTHFAGLVGTRTLTIFGSPVSGFGFAPRGENDVVVENKELKCRPCGLHGRRECPLGTMECMSSVTVDIVLSSIDED